LQAAMLVLAAPLVNRGGRIVYATCSLLPDENERQVQTFLAQHAEFTLMPVAGIWQEAVGAELPAGCETYLRLTPLRHGTDGFFAAVLLRSGVTTA
jgi:16S rRNA (cytosine967-C5)-methyltransferase